MPSTAIGFSLSGSTANDYPQIKAIDVGNLGRKSKIQEGYFTMQKDAFLAFYFLPPSHYRERSFRSLAMPLRVYLHRDVLFRVERENIFQPLSSYIYIYIYIHTMIIAFYRNRNVTFVSRFRCFFNIIEQKIVNFLRNK